MKAILCVLLFLYGSNCFAQKTEGAYRIQRTKNTLDNKSVLSGSVVDFTTNQPLTVAFVRIDSTCLNTDTSGHFSVPLLPGKHQLQAGFIGYYKINIGAINVGERELINILIRVKEDGRPLID